MILSCVAPDWGHPNWGLAASGIKCRADAIGANVYHVKDRAGEALVLAHTREDATAAFRNARPEQIKWFPEPEVPLDQ